MPASRRRMILDAHELQYAPPHRQEAFWRHYNEKRRWGPSRLGDLADRLLSDTALQSAHRLREVAAAWQAVVPAEYVSLSRVDGLSGGRLRVIVDSAATKYSLSRHLGDNLLRLLNGRLSGAAIKGIHYRVGCLAGDA